MWSLCESEIRLFFNCKESTQTFSKLSHEDNIKASYHYPLPPLELSSWPALVQIQVAPIQAAEIQVAYHTTWLGLASHRMDFCVWKTKFIGLNLVLKSVKFSVCTLSNNCINDWFIKTVTLPQNEWLFCHSEVINLSQLPLKLHYCKFVMRTSFQIIT